METNFNNFITEKAGYPNEIRPYSNLVYDFLQKEVVYFFSRKGWANYNIKIEFDWDDIKDIIKKDDFKKLPIEEITIYFGINLANVRSFGVDGTYYPVKPWNSELNSKMDYPNSYMIHSKSDIINKSIHVNIRINLEIPSRAKSLGVEMISSWLRSTINHELQHSFQNAIIKGSKGEINKSSKFMLDRNYSIINVAGNLSDADETSSSDTLTSFFYFIYLCNKEEFSAIISGSRDASSYEEAKEMAGLFDDMMNFSKNIESKYQEIIKEFKESIFKNKSNEKIVDWLNDYPKIFSKMYIKNCKKHKEIPDPKIVDLKNKDFLYMLKFFSKDFERFYDKYKRKISKVWYVHHSD